MASITGAQTLVGLDVAGTFATPDAVTQLLPVMNFNQSDNNSVLQSDEIGLAKVFQTDKDLGDINPTLSWSQHISCGTTVWAKPFAVFAGTSGAPSEVTGGQLDYRHRITFNSTLNAKWVTFAILDSSGTTLEWPSVAIDSLTLNYAPLQYLTADFTAQANIRNLSSATNTTAVIGALTAPAVDHLVVAQSDFFALNAQAGGALSSSDKLTNVKSVTVSYSKPQESPRLIKGSAGNGQTRSTGLYNCTVTVVLDALEDHTYYTAAAAGTEYKALIAVEGSQIGTGANRGLTTYFPRLKLIQDPAYNLASTGQNDHVLVFDALAAASNPTGMNDINPYFEFIIPTTSTSLLA